MNHISKEIQNNADVAQIYADFSLFSCFTTCNTKP